MRIDQKLLNILVNSNEPVSGKKLAFELGVSEKTVMKYVSLLKEDLSECGAAQLITRQRVGSFIVVDDETAFLRFVSKFNDNSLMEDPLLRKRYVLMRLMMTDDYLNIYMFADEISVSPSLLRSIIKEIKPVLDSYSLKLDHSHFHGYRITGKEEDIRRCIVHECKESETIASVFTGGRFAENEKDIIRRIISKTLEQYYISVSSKSVSSLTLHTLIAINRIETDNAIELDQPFEMMKIKTKPEYFAALQINDQLKKQLNISLPENELIYWTLHIAGQQRMIGHEPLKTEDNQEAQVFYQRFLRRIWQIADEDFFKDAELRINLLNHIIPFLNRYRNKMLIEKTEMNNIKSEFPYAYDLAVTGLSILDDYHIKIPEAEISYFALHLQLAIEKRLFENSIKFNVLVVCEEGYSVFKIYSYRLQKEFDSEINEVVFTSFSDMDKYELNDFQIILNTSRFSEGLPERTLTVTPYMNEQDIMKIRGKINQLSSSIVNTVMMRDYLFFDMEAETRQELLEKMTAEIRNHIQLPDDFVSRVEKRESFASTEFDNRIAVPHPLTSDDISSFICTARLNKPLIWKEKPVQLVFLISNNSEINPWFYDKLSRIINSPALSQELISASGFDEFQKIFETI